MWEHSSSGHLSIYHFVRWRSRIQLEKNILLGLTCSYVPALDRSRSRRRIKSIRSPVEPEQEGVRKRRRDDPVLFHTALVPEAENSVEAVVHVMGLGWALVHTGNAQCLVCFKRLHCWNTSLSFLSLSVVSREMWKWFLLLDLGQILLGGMSFAVCLSLRPYLQSFIW